MHMRNDPARPGSDPPVPQQRPQPERRVQVDHVDGTDGGRAPPSPDVEAPTPPDSRALEPHPRRERPRERVDVGAHPAEGTVAGATEQDIEQVSLGSGSVGTAKDRGGPRWVIRTSAGDP